MIDMDKNNLSLFEAASVVAGLGVGGGIMAVPYLASLNGLLVILVVMVVAYFASVLLHLMVAEMTLRDGGNRQLVELFGKYLFKGKAGKALTWIFFACIGLTFFGLLAGYIVGCGEILTKLAGIPLWLSELVTYAVAAGVVFIGLKAIGISEKYAIAGIAVILIILCAGSSGVYNNSLPLHSFASNKALALFGMVMFSFSCFFSIPQAVEGLSWNTRLVPWAVVIGIGINFIFVLLITFMSVMTSTEVTEVAIIGWGQAIGGWALALGSVTAFLAMLTSYWAVSYALAVIVKERLGIQDKISWLIATAPTLVIALSGITGFLGFMRLTGGAIAVMVAIMIVPALRASRKEGPVQQGIFNMGLWGGTAFQILVILAYLLMAVGSLVSIE